MKPITDLHLHLDGALRVSTMLDLAKSEGVALPAADEAGLRAALGCGTVRKSFVECLSFFQTTLSVMQSRRAIARVTREQLEDCARLGLTYIEPRFSPLLHCQRGLSAWEALEAALGEIEHSQSKYGIRSNLILCGLWHFTPRETELIAALGLAYQNHAGGVAGLDMAGNEMDSSIRLHAKHLRRARERGLGLTVHAAESGPAEHVLTAIDAVRPNRIGHGTRAGDRFDIIDRLAKTGVTVEACISSNRQTRVIAAHDDYPLELFMDNGVAVCLNSDDPLMMDTDVVREFEIERRELDVTPEQETILHAAGINASFAIPLWKQEMREELERRSKTP